MSKSLGNSPDPLDLIEKYGADGVRVGMLLCSPAGNDLPFDESLCEQGRNFSNKIWNAFRLVKGWTIDDSKKPTEAAEITINWFQSKFTEQLSIINDHYAKYRISDALMATYKLVWDDFCSWYLELVKPDFIDGQAQPIDRITYNSTIDIFKDLLKLMHPFMPFITEELWHLMEEEQGSIMIATWPENMDYDEKSLSEFNLAMDVITNVRNIRKSKNISPKESLELYLKTESSNDLIQPVILKLGNISRIIEVKEPVGGAASFVVKQHEFFIPLGANIDLKEEKERLKKELEYNKGFLKSVDAKLSNERFVSNAKQEVIENEWKKKADVEAKIKAIESQLAGM
jgi:valyl-tRNA synthetase